MWPGFQTVRSVYIQASPLSQKLRLQADLNAKMS